MSRARRDPTGSLENGAVIVGVGLAGHQLKTQLPISRSGRRVESVDRDRREVLLGPGQVLRYEQLVLATGVRARTLDVSGLPLAGVCTLRMLHDAQQLRRRLDDAKNVLAVGAGFIAGLVVDRPGIVVDEFLRTSDPFVYAIGDVISFPSSVARGQARVESVQNAIDQARCLADTLSGTPSPYQDLPLFWSHQAATPRADRRNRPGGWRGPRSQVTGPGAAFHSCYHADKLVAIESVDQPRIHMKARRLLRDGISIPPGHLADPVRCPTAGSDCRLR